MLECLWSKRYDLKRVNVVHIESYFVQYLDIMNIRLVSQYYQWPTLDVMFILQKQLTSNLSFSLQILPQMSVRPNHPHKHTQFLCDPLTCDVSQSLYVFSTYFIISPRPPGEMDQTALHCLTPPSHEPDCPRHQNHSFIFKTCSYSQVWVSHQFKHRKRRYFS